MMSYEVRVVDKRDGIRVVFRKEGYVTKEETFAMVGQRKTVVTVRRMWFSSAEGNTTVTGGGYFPRDV